MPQIQATSGQGNISISNLKVTTPTVTNTVLTLANTEYSVVLPANTTRFRIQARGTARLQLAYAPAGSGTTFLTISPGSYYLEDNINRASTTIYIQSSKSGETLEVISWV